MTDPHHLHENLEIFRDAANWKAYWSQSIARHVGDRVLEAGAGVGANTAILMKPGEKRFWVCMEPDLALTSDLKRAETGGLAVASTTAAFASAVGFDTILYIDVLEHIEDDAGELEQSARLLKPGGKLIVLSPAYNFLYSEYDRAIGHYRRYSRKSLLAVSPPGARLAELFFLDAPGLLLSLGNKLLLREAQPTRSQIMFWDRVVIPIARILDPVLGYRFGRSIIAVWEREH